jgi:hypothetical protein
MTATAPPPHLSQVCDPVQWPIHNNHNCFFFFFFFTSFYTFFHKLSHQLNQEKKVKKKEAFELLN